MNVLVTAGPSFEPIDQVRRLTNFSTGELGALLANELAAAGCAVTCLRGVGATYRGPTAPGVTEVPFSTNDDLLAQWSVLSRTQPIDAVFHVAALCDFKLDRVADDTGHALSSPKIDSGAGALTLRLVPARKLIRELRALFPKATLVGWKYELAGTRSDALAKAWRQIQENRTDACVLNGQAWGDGFAFCTPPDRVEEINGKARLAEFLAAWIKSRPVANPATG